MPIKDIECGKTAILKSYSMCKDCLRFALTEHARPCLDSLHHAFWCSSGSCQSSLYMLGLQNCNFRFFLMVDVNRCH